MSVATSKPEKQRERKTAKKMEQNIQEVWDNYKKCNTCVTGILEEERKRRKIWSNNDRISPN